MKELHEITCEHCGKKRMAKMDKTRFCNNKCGAAAWRVRNPREKRGMRNTEAREICANDGVRRDTKKTWIKYMRNNPCYASALGRVNIERLGI